MKERKVKIILRWLIPLLCAVFVIVIMFLKFSIDIREDAINTVEKEIEETTEKYALRIANDLQSICASGKTTAQVIGQYTSKDMKIIQQLLEAVVDQTQIYEAVYCDENGTFINHDGEYITLPKDAYEEVLTQDSEVKYIYKSDDGISGKAAILVKVSVSPDKGCLLLFYSMDRIESLIKINQEFDQTAFAVMVDKDGNVLPWGEIKSNFLSKGNIWNNVDKKYQNAEIQAKVSMQNYMTSSVALSSDGEERTLIFTPVGINDWNLVIGINQSYVESSHVKIWMKTMMMLFQFLGVVVLFFIFYAIVNLIGKWRSTEKSKSLQEKADTDLLTGLNNKLATERKIKEYIRDYPDSRAMMFVLDIDSFKKINDTLGHTFGDEVLRALGKQIGVNFRVTDIIGRTGGDEFTIFLKELKDESSCLKEAQKLVDLFRGFQVGEYVKYSATASIGAAVFPENGKDFESLYKAADQALYKAKERGKNQLAFFDDRARLS